MGNQHSSPCPSLLHLAGLLACATFSAHAGAATDAVAAYPNFPLVSEVQTSGGGASPDTDEFIELYNPWFDLSLNGFSIQYRSPSGTFQMIDLTGLGTIPYGGYVLVAGTGFDGPATPRATYSFDLSASGGSVFVVQSTTLLTSCASPAIKDRLAYGSGATLCAEGGAAPAPAPGGSLERKPGASNPSCGNMTDTGNNALDFALRADAEPQSQFSASELCADLAVSQSDSPDPVTAGGNLTYVVTLDNLGPVILPDPTYSNATLPSTVTFVSTSGCANDPNGYPTCQVGVLQPGAPISYTLRAATRQCLGQGTVLTESVTASAPQVTDPSPANNTSTATTTVNDPGTCNDGSACTFGDVCVNGLCSGTPLNCDDGDPCTADYCTQPTGCQNVPFNCDDSNSCTTDACTGASCSHTNRPGQACDDGSACTVGDQCNAAGNACVPGAAINCDDGNPCTDDACNPSAGCIHGAHCYDDNDCTANNCDPTTGACSYPPVPDGSGCFLPEACGARCDQGFCHSGGCPDDGNPCTYAICHFGGHCVTFSYEMGHACDDGEPCTFNDRCDSSQHCAGTPSWMVCDPGPYSCFYQTCDPAISACKTVQRPACNVCDGGSGTCDAAGACQPVSPQVDSDHDGRPDGCDCFPQDPSVSGPPEAILLEVNKYPGAPRLEWTLDQAGAGANVQYDVIRGALDQLQYGAAGLQACLALEYENTYLADAVSPLPAQGFWYLVRGRNICGVGVYGRDSSGTPKDSSACP